VTGNVCPGPMNEFLTVGAQSKDRIALAGNSVASP